MLVLLAGTAVLLPASSDTIFRANANLVELTLVVTDESGKYIPGLQASDLRVYEDGQEQTIRSFLDAWTADSNDPSAAVNIYILFDTSDTMYDSFPGTEDSIAACIRSLRPADLIAINTFSGNMKRLSALSWDHMTALRNLRQAISGGKPRSTTLLCSVCAMRRRLPGARPSSYSRTDRIKRVCSLRKW